MDTTVRPFDDSDPPGLWAVYYAAVHQTAAAHYTAEQLDAWAPADFDQEKWQHRLRDLSPFVAERGGVLVGYADLQPSGYIDHFFVSPAVARQGVGSLLMEAIHRSAASNQLGSLFADVSLTARPFFERWGFTVEEETSLLVRGCSLKNFRMTKRLVIVAITNPRSPKRHSTRVGVKGSERNKTA